MPDTFTSLRTRLDTPTLIAALGCDKVANFSCQCLCTWTFYDLLRYRSSLNLRLTKRRELWLISPFYGWNTILGSIFFFFFFESFGNLVKQTTRIIIISLLFMGVETIFFAFTLFHSLKLFLRTLWKDDEEDDQFYETTRDKMLELILNLNLTDKYWNTYHRRKLLSKNI